jgi:hypothetical protein
LAPGHAIANTIAYTRVVTKDGRMFTLSDDSADADGKPVSNVLVFDDR